MYRAGVGTHSAHEMTIGSVSYQQISPMKEQIVIYRPDIGPDSFRDALRATLAGNHRAPSLNIGRKRSHRTSGHRTHLERPVILQAG